MMTRSPLGQRRVASDTNLDMEAYVAKSQSVGAMEAGVKVKMPVGLLGHVTRAQSTLEELRKSGGVEGVVTGAFKKFEAELMKLKDACDQIKPADDVQKAAKQAWVERNVMAKLDYLNALRGVFDVDHPVLQVNDKEMNDTDSMKSARSPSVRSVASSAARREAAAKTKALEMEMEHRRRLRKLEEQERQLRLQREDEELALKIQQSRLLEEALESERGSQVQEPPQEQGQQRTFPNVSAPQFLPAVSTWAPRSQVVADTAPRMASWAPGETPTAPAFDSTQGLLQQVLLPHSTLPTFKGEHLEFMWFLKAFEMRVEAVTLDPVRRLHLLLQHLEGDPKTLVMGCQLAANPAVGYARAKEKLVEKYGNKVRQALAFKAKLLAWPSIKKDAGTDLEKFSIQLQLCQEVKLNGGLAELDAAGTILTLMQKLPHKMQESWQMRAYKIECNQVREADFDDFTRFVSDLAAARNHPVYGLKGDVKVDSRKGARVLATSAGGQDAHKNDDNASVQTRLDSTITESSRATAAQQNDAYKAPCLLCQRDHATDKCRAASQMTLKEKRRKLQGLCFACLKPEHTAKDCPKRSECSKCKGSHPTIMHFERSVKDDHPQEGQGKPTTEKTEQNKSKVSQESTQKGPDAKVCAALNAGRVAVAVVPVKLWCGQDNTARIVKAILDPGSTATFITQELVRKMGLISQPSTLKLTTMTTTSQSLETNIVMGVRATGLDQNGIVTLPPMFTVDSMPYRNEDVARETDVIKWKHLRDIPFNWASEANVELLIGMNAPDALRPLEVVSGEGDNEPYAVRTMLGWCLNGPLTARTNKTQAVANLINAGDVASRLERLHELDCEGAYSFDEKGPSQEDLEWLKQVEASVQKVPGSQQYEIALPFRQLPPPLHDNREQAMQRLNGLRKRFTVKESRFKNDYVAFMQKMEQQGYVEEVRDGEITPKCGQVVSYVPHHGVYHPRKPNKIRVVFNCSSKYREVSLNDCLIPGPDLTNSLLGVLIRFRQESVAFMADVESMFYRVQVPEDGGGRDMLRYLWWPGGDTSKPPRTYRMKVHLFGATSSPSCANFALRRAAEDAFQRHEVTQEVMESVKKNFYVDDCLKSMPTEVSATQMALDLVKACASGGFRLTKFVSTSKKLLRALPSAELGNSSEMRLDDNKHDPLGSWQERALGVRWDIASDMFLVSASVVTQEGIPTKRNVLSLLSSVYDPLGIAAPVIIAARILFRDLTKDQKLSWDDDLNERPHVLEQWKTWCNELNKLNSVQLHRCFRPDNTSREANWQMHVFCDASENAYSTVVYLRQWLPQEERAHVIFVVGKARVSPPKVMTIPRLELTAAKLATDVANMVGKELQYKVKRRVFWTDSQTVLKYLSNKVRRFHTFVANRVGAILAASQLEEWRHVPTQENPADEGSRGMEASRLAQGDCLWLNGPQFLHHSESEWPAPRTVQPIQQGDPEVQVAATKAPPQTGTDFVETLATRYSTFNRLTEAVRVWKHFMQGRSKWASTSVTRQDARISLVKSLQENTWPEERSILHKGGLLHSRSPIYKLNPMLDQQGVLVIGSRTRQNLPIIPGRSKVASLIAQEAHHIQAHFGRQATMAQILKSYWITGLNKLVRKIVRDCPKCQRQTARPNYPKMGELPIYRIQSGGRAFVSTGVDYFGPFVIKKVKSTATVKMYGVIFTCAATRAVHLEVAEDLSASGYINALRRFIARRGHVTRLISDNGTNFTGAKALLDQELTKELRQLQRTNCPVAKWLSRKAITWSFNPPGASHHGGFWERLIRSIRRVLAMLLPDQRPLTYDGLVTVMCEAEAVLNNRPLIAVSEDLDDFEALTPNHLLLGAAGPAAPPGDYNRVSIPLKKQWRQVQHITTCFWRRWLKEYQALLRQRSKWIEDKGRSLEVNDVVLVMDNTKPREYWPLGRVTDLHPGKDGKVRVVSVKTVKGVLKRPVTKVCVLEAASESLKSHA